MVLQVKDRRLGGSSRIELSTLSDFKGVDFQAIAPRTFRETGPISRILSYGSPITLVVPGRASSTHDRNLALARRLAYNLQAYLGIDCDILSDTEVARDRSSSPRRHAVIVFGGPFENKYAEAQLDVNMPIEFDSQHPGCFKIRHRKFNEAGTGKWDAYATRRIFNQ